MTVIVYLPTKWTPKTEGRFITQDLKTLNNAEQRPSLGQSMRKQRGFLCPLSPNQTRMFISCVKTCSLSSWSHPFLHFGLERKLLPSSDHFNMQVCSTSWLHSWLRDLWVDRISSKSRILSIRYRTCLTSLLPKRQGGHPLPWPSVRAPRLMAVGTPWPQSDQACRRIWKGRLHSRVPPSFWRQFLHCSLLPVQTFKPSYSPGLGSCVSQALPELLNPERRVLTRQGAGGSMLKPRERLRHSSLWLAFFCLQNLVKTPCPSSFTPVMDTFSLRFNQNHCK